MSPAASTLKKLIRDPKCHPVLRGILETLLHYITDELHKWAAKSRNLEKSVSSVAGQKNTGCPDGKSEAIVKQIQLEICRNMIKLPELQITTHKETLETNFSISEKLCLDSQKSRLLHKADTDQRTGDLIARRITTFQLLQSKFTRSTPKPPVTQQREVGSLSSSGGVPGNVSHHQGSEHNKHKRDAGKKPQQPKRENTVKNIVAKFAMAEQKERGLESVKKEPVKPALIGRGILLSSIMKRFESMATVCEGSGLKHSHEEVKVATSIKERAACFKREQKDGGRSIQKQSKQKQVKNKLVGYMLKRGQMENGQEHRTQVVQILTNTTLHVNVTTHTSTEQTEDQPTHGETQCLGKDASLNDDIHVKVQGSQECGNMQTTAESMQGQSQCIANGLKFAQPEQLFLTPVMEWSLPQRLRGSQQVEVPLSWHVATITTCSPEWARCVPSSLEKYLQAHNPEDTGHLDKTPWKTKDSTQVPPKCSHSESPTSIPGEKSTYVIKGVYGDTGHDPVKNRDADHSGSTNTQRRLPSYVIPRVYGFDHQQDPVKLSPQLEPQAEAHLVAAPPGQMNSSVTALDDVSESVETFQDTVPDPPDDFSLHVKYRKKPVEGKQQDNEERERKEEFNLVSRSSQQGNAECSADTTLKERDSCAATLLEIQPEVDSTKHKPKYTTINYGDPSVKQPYKPKVIRFTDTFTF